MPRFFISFAREKVMVFCCGLSFFLLALPGWLLSARHASFVFDAESGAVIHEVNADAVRHPASLTKMMTLYLLFSALDEGRINFATRLPVSADAARRPPSKLGLRSGEEIDVLNAVMALVTKSANDVATVVAESLAGSEDDFVAQMNSRARELGLKKTNFSNASGLPDIRQTTTARDMAELARALWRDFPHYYHFFSVTSFSFRGREHENHNKMLNEFSGLDGVKTGYIRMSGYNLAASAVRDGRRLFAVVMGGRSPDDRNSFMSGLLERSFSGQSELFDFRSPGGWALQVGAFQSQAAAVRILEKLSDKLGLSEKSQAVLPLESRKGVLYRARLVGFAENEARKIRTRLAEMKVESFLVPPLEQSASATGIPGGMN